jgi:hypothetical protein
LSNRPFTLSLEHGMTAHPQQVPARDTFIIAKAGDAYRVYSPDQPNQLFFVSGDPEHPVCTCPEFRAQASDPTVRCSHVTAVFGNEGGVATFARMA